MKTQPKPDTIACEPLVLEGGAPVRTRPLPLEFPGMHYLDEAEIAAVVRVLKSRSLFRYYGIDLKGEVEAFEGEFAEFIGVKHALAVSSGSAALQTALSALGAGPGQEVIVPAYLWVAVVAAVINLGAVPVLAEIDDTFTLDPRDLENHITPRTTGMIAVHMSGAPANLPALVEIARQRRLFLLEDCAQCAGGSIGGKKVGSFGNMGIFSFQMNKNMSSGEGGCVVTNDQRLYQRAVAAHDNGYARDESGRAIFDNLDLCLWGRGCRLDEVRGAILRVQLEKLPKIIRHMRESKYRIRGALEGFPQVRWRRIVDRDGDTGAFLILTLDRPSEAQRIQQALAGEGIATSSQGITNVVMTNWGLHIYSNIVSLVGKTSTDGRGFPWSLAENRDSKVQYGKGTCPFADSLFERSLLLAIPSCLTEDDEDDIIHAFRKVLAQ
ncbi:MAG TPA: DegT/DnrJ/EryC1/StrS family aminotransferase [Terriglobales bacterium]|nr:DegT/DnrJ/EryC1/StrS family aminotransferase [Terriglobales bacterium]